MCVDPNDDDTLYLLCGCAYFSDARTVIFRSRDAGETFEEIDVTDLIQVHGNGYGDRPVRQSPWIRTTRISSTAAAMPLPAILPSL